MCTRKKSSSPKIVPLFCSNSHPSKAEEVQEICWSELIRPILPVFAGLAGCKSSAATSPLLDILKYGPLSRSDPWAVFKLESGTCSHTSFSVQESYSMYTETFWPQPFITLLWRTKCICVVFQGLCIYSGWQEHFDSWRTLLSELSYGMELPEESNDRQGLTSCCLCMRELGSITAMYSVRARTHLHQALFGFNSLITWMKASVTVLIPKGFNRIETSFQIR